MICIHSLYVFYVKLSEVRFVIAEMTYDMCAEIDEDPAILHITDTASTVSYRECTKPINF